MIRYDLEPNRTALVVVDMQRCFVEPEWGGAEQGLEVLARLNRFAAACREAGIPVIYTAHELDPDGSNAGLLPQLSQTAAKGFVNAGHSAAQLHPALEVRPDDLVVTKSRFGAFHATDLELILRGRHIDTLIVGGIATNFCVETTVREAVARDFRVLMLSDGTTTSPLAGPDGASISTDELQRLAFAVVGAVFGEVLSVDAALGRIRALKRQEIPR